VEQYQRVIDDGYGLFDERGERNRNQQQR